MKKRLGIFLAAALTFGAAGNALAYFSDLSLVQVGYQTATGGSETITDVGNVSTILSGLTSGSQTFSGLSLTGALNLAYFAYDNNTGDIWFSAKDGLTPRNYNQANVPGTKTKLNTVYGYYTLNGNSQVTVGKTASTSTFYKAVDASAGNFGALLSSISGVTGTGDVKAFTVGSSAPATQGFYHLDWQNGAGSLDLTEVATVTTNTNGSFTLNAMPVSTPTPIPPSFFLLGSGVLGMFGLRRKRG